MFNCTQKATAGLIIRNSLAYNENAMPIKLKLHVIRALYYWSKFFFSETVVTAFGRDWVSACTRVAFFPSPFSLSCHVLILCLSSNEHQLSTNLAFSCVMVLFFSSSSLCIYSLLDYSKILEWVAHANRKKRHPFTEFVLYMFKCFRL